MSRLPFKWPADGSGAMLQQHSVAKLDVLREYLIAYFQTLVTAPGQEEVRLTLVDGFAGGGVFRHADTKERILGSPLVFLKASEQAQAIINAQRSKPVQFRIAYIFVEKDRNAAASLLTTLKAEGYGARIGQDIQVVRSTFEAQSQSIIDAIKDRSPQVGRSVISLDQYGYKDVPTGLIRRILTQLPRAEILLTFAVDALINFASDKPATHSILSRLGIPDVLKGRTIADIKANESDFRLLIQSSLYQDLVKNCGARFYTVFFIKTAGHGDYWLVHLSQHPRARDVMTQVHWEHNNHFIHYGGAGLDMFQVLGYAAHRDESYTGQSSFGFEFDGHAHAASVSALTEQLAQRVHALDAVTFGTLYSTTCNSTPADSLRYRQAIEQLVAHKELVVTAAAGGYRRKASTIRDSDVIRRANQRNLLFVS
ncbi:three-Cys-motif partner protein TcmP [Frateuria edaphi]|uniref:three-Cys-motif partner protein TcmP n=1 Tax=Frateuria edaphi TaxID=2898793 RepID=UPI001E28A821|nr:three-Cys-motif partner protein TcmP [Frateuria edaphi]UGB44647.1 three-Cys-motif partner protein TcmP [Frateuria edaphi]